ncbi:octopamine receptor beta-2R-like [Acanthaster planci]|uniref:Octopamine receptor beta-2R-like n=1 Tax=Acanthaster planci TaxID=133434 RepID=A0A8B7YXT7_ACAPL|nr:octopamine receptor beta-2R-like [Acanthaster planci]
MRSTEHGSSSHGNSSDVSALTLPPVIQGIAQAVLVIVIGLNALGYSWIIITTIRYRQLRVVSNFFLVNLCGAELLFCTVLVPVAFAVVLQGDWDVRPAEINAGIAFICVLILSGFFLSASLWITDKNVKLFKPLAYPRLATLCHFAISTVICWGSALLLASFVFLGLVTASSASVKAVSFPTFILGNWWVLLLLFDGLVVVCVSFITFSNIAVIRLAFKQHRKINSGRLGSVAFVEPASPADRQQDSVFNIQLRPSHLMSRPRIERDAAAGRVNGDLRRQGARTASRRLSFIIYACTFTVAWSPAITLVNLHVFSSIEISSAVIGISAMVAVGQSSFATLVYTLKGQEYRAYLSRQLTHIRRISQIKINTCCTN